ncbi:LysM domain-containing protein [Apibacter muscae]|uniref:LysM peptidoglycan-binding domain-containing protein n=1 Tax=Apibacter muscae TaxID=2509004 RepID=UPI0011ACBE92|nr:LysM domain-containing protein [Apibacter muscae]TWP30885.1 LysM domain-containing protein [Apibacter muscae]
MSEEYKLHWVEGEEKLSAIAQKYNISIEELKKANPEMRTFYSGFFGGAEYASAMQKIRIPVVEEIVIKPTVPTMPSYHFEPLARYRCEQLNISRIKQEIITFSAHINTEYLFSADKEDKKILQILLEDYQLSVEPIHFKGAFEFAKKIEELKKKISFSQNNKGEIREILNLGELRQEWDNFKNKVLPTDALYQSLKEQTPKQAQDVIDTGNKEFSSSQLLGSTLGKNLFFHILLRANVGDELKDYTLKQFSQLFPNLELTIPVVKSKVKEDNFTTTYRLVGTLDRTHILEEELEKMYNEWYKPLIKYSYTEFSYVYRITYTIENKNNHLLEAKAALCEKIKNNFEAMTEFTIKQVEL